MTSRPPLQPPLPVIAGGVAWGAVALTQWLARPLGGEAPSITLGLVAGAAAALLVGGAVWLGLRPLVRLSNALETVAEDTPPPATRISGPREVRQIGRGIRRWIERLARERSELHGKARGLESVLAARGRDLRRIEQKYRTLVGQAEEGILAWDPETLEILESNARGAELLGRRPRDLRGRSLEELVAPTARVATVRRLDRVSREGSITLRDVAMLREGGESLPVDMKASIVRFGDGELVLAMIRDLTAKRDLDRKAALLAEQLLETEKIASIGLLAAGVAHEVNNPMGYVASNVNRLVEDAHQLQHLIWHSTPSHDERRGRIADLLIEIDDITQEIHEGVRRVTQIIMALREFAHGGTEEGVLEYADLNRVVRNCLTLLHNRIKNRIQVDLELEPLPPVRCHPTQIAQVLMNLLINAAQAVEATGRIRIASYDSGERIHIAVEDDGRGIESDHLRRIFEPFFTTKPVGQGTGLGLAVSREIVRRHGGELTVDSVVGRGTRLVVEIPCEPPVTVGTAPARSSAPADARTGAPTQGSGV